MQPLPFRQSDRLISRLGWCYLGASEGMRPPMRSNRRPRLTRDWSWASRSSIQLTSLAWLSMNGTPSTLGRFGMCRERLIAAMSALQCRALDWERADGRALPQAGGW